MEKVKMLAIEDEPYHERAFFAMLKEVCPSIEVTIATSFQEGIDRYTGQDFDVLLVDLRLEGSEKQGDDFIRLIRENNPNILIYVLTGVEYGGFPSEKGFTEKYGIKKWIKKPKYAGDIGRMILADINAQKGA
jgi:CheY-like chemotaxis protein